MARIILSEDDASLRRVLQFQLSEVGHAVRAFPNAEDALGEALNDPPDLVVTDVQLPDWSGLDLLKTLREKGELCPVVVITAFGTIEQAVEAMRAGATDYLTKPFGKDEFRLRIERALQVADLKRENERLREVVAEAAREPVLLGKDPAFLKALQTARKAADSDATILITGESGTGKELVAREIHRLSPHREGPFVAVSCAALPRDLLESELFGHRRGAFTGAVRDQRGKFELAQGGTLFLDEIAEIPLEVQAKLLRALQEREIAPLGSARALPVDARVAAATNADLGKRLREGRFRDDLYYRLNVIRIELPPLRARAGDVEGLLKHHLGRAARGKNLILARETLELLRDYEWPGNVRELANLCERLALLHPGGPVSPADLPPEMQPSAPRASAPAAEADGDLRLDHHERRLIEEALQRTQGNKSQAARLLGIPRYTLLHRLKKLGVEA